MISRSMSRSDFGDSFDIGLSSFTIIPPDYFNNFFKVGSIASAQISYPFSFG